MRQASRIPAFESWTEYLMAWLDRRTAGHARRHRRRLDALKIQDDPEAIFQEGWLLCDVGEHEAGLDLVQRAVAKGYFVAPTLQRSPQFDALRGDPASKPCSQKPTRDASALAAFREAGGERLLGRRVASESHSSHGGL